MDYRHLELSKVQDAAVIRICKKYISERLPHRMGESLPKEVFVRMFMHVQERCADKAIRKGTMNRSYSPEDRNAAAIGPVGDVGHMSTRPVPR